MRKGDKVIYEWKAVGNYESGHAIRIEERLDQLLPLQKGERLMLVKFFWSNTHLDGGESLEDQAEWCPLERGGSFDNGDPIPKRLELEFEKKRTKCIFTLDAL